MASNRNQQVFVALLAAGATVLGGVIGGCASYFATREANRGVVERDERADRLDARSAAQLVDAELGDVQAGLLSLRTRNLDAAALGVEFRKLPTSAWTANQQKLARTLTADDWGYVSLAYALLRLLPGNAADLTRLIPGPKSAVRGQIHSVTLPFLQKEIETAREHLLPYE